MLKTILHFFAGAVAFFRRFFKAQRKREIFPAVADLGPCNVQWRGIDLGTSCGSIRYEYETENVVIIPFMRHSLDALADVLMKTSLEGELLVLERNGKPKDRLTFFKAFPKAQVDWYFDQFEQRIIEAQFKCLPNNNGMIWQLGDSVTAEIEKRGEGDRR